MTDWLNDIVSGIKDNVLDALNKDEMVDQDCPKSFEPTRSDSG